MRRRIAAVALGLTIALTAGCIAPPVAPDGRWADLRPYTGFTNGAVLTDLNPIELAYVLNGMKDTGAQWVRIDLIWGKVQPNGPDEWDWSIPDFAVQAAVSRGLKVLLMPTYTPPWARPDGETVYGEPLSSHAGPANPDDFARFCSEAAKRYKNLGVAHWQIWNEPNNWLFWEPVPDPEAYAVLLEKSSAAIHAEIPSATVVTGGVSPGNNRADGLLFAPWTFLERIYAAGVKDSFQAVGYHPYSFPYWPLTPSEYNFFYNAPWMYGVMVQNGAAGKQVWATEVGFPTGTYPGAVSEEEQAKIVTHIVWGWFAYEFAGPLFLFTYIDYEPSPLQAFGNMGLVRIDGTPKPSLSTFMYAINANGDP